MSNVTGRHRRRRRGWVAHARWIVGGVLAALLGVASTPRIILTEACESAREPRTTKVSAVSQEPAWVGRYERAQRLHASRARAHYLEAERQSPPAWALKTGWCVDDDGVRGVRPYLVCHEQRAGNMSYSSERVIPPGKQMAAAGPAPHGGSEWAELAGLVRQWVELPPQCHA